MIHTAWFTPMLMIEGRKSVPHPRGPPPMSPLDRRQLLQGLAAAPLAAAHERRERIHSENARPGTTDWQLTYTRVDPKTRFRCPWIEGFAGRASVTAGEKIDLFVSTDPPRHSPSTCTASATTRARAAGTSLSLGPFAGQDPAHAAGRRAAAARVPVGQMHHAARYRRTGPAASTSASCRRRNIAIRATSIFIVRDDRPADFLFQCSDNTWQAYNAWPDSYSLYHNDRKDGKVLVSGVQVSYDRPYGKYVQISTTRCRRARASSCLWEFPARLLDGAAWLRRHLLLQHRRPRRRRRRLLRCKAFLSVGPRRVLEPGTIRPRHGGGRRRASTPPSCRATPAASSPR